MDCFDDHNSEPAAGGPNGVRHRDRVWIAGLFCTILLAPPGIATAQTARMAIEGSVQLDGPSVPSGTVYRLLRSDGSIVRTIAPYPTNALQFGVRISSTDKLNEGESLSLRVVVSRRDSFIARVAGPDFRFRGTLGGDPPVTRVLFFRNHPPTVRRQCPDTTLNEGQTFRFRVTTLDADGDTLHFRVLTGPQGLAVDPQSGYLSWSPSFEQSGQHAVVVGVTDHREEVFSRHATIRVRNVNRPPRVERHLPDLEVREGQLVTLPVQAVDPDRDSLNYSLIERAYHFRLFSHTGVFDWTPTYDNEGSYRCVVTVTDGIASDTTNEFRIVVRNTNRPPRFARGLLDTIAMEDVSLTVEFKARDEDEDSVRYELLLAPEGVNVDDRGTLTWRPTYDQSGSYVIVVASHDGQDTVEGVIRLLVLNQNRSPVPQMASTVPDTQRFAYGRPFELTWPSAADPDAEDTLRYAIHLRSAQFDTTIAGITDTSLTFLGRTRLTPDNIYHWTVAVSDGFAEAPLPGVHSFRLVPIPVNFKSEPPPLMPRGFALGEAQNNPTGTMTSLTYSIAERSDVNLSVFTMLGERIETITSGERDAGVYEATFDASRLASGVYMFKLEAHPLAGIRTKDFVSTKRMVLVK